VELTFGSDPSGLQLTVGSSSGTTPFTRTVIAGSKNSVSAPSPQSLAGNSYEFASWSDGGAQSHDIVAPDSAATYTATYRRAASTGTQSLTSVADAGLSELSPNTNNGSATTLKVDGDDPDPGGGDLYAALRWNLSQIPAGATVTSASVTLNVTNPSPQTYGAYELKKAWNEGQLTWNQAATGSPWATAGAKATTDRGSQIASVTPTNIAPYTFTIPASVVQGWLSAPSSNNGILLAHTTNFDGFVFGTKEGASAPKLTLTYTTSGGGGGSDTTPPETTIGSGPSGTVSSTSASFTFSSSEAGSTFECSLDGASFTRCASPQSYTSLSGGSHTFQVRATDGAGNVDATPATRTWTVSTAPPPDTTPPNTTINSGPSGTVSSTSASFTFSSSEAGSTFECSLDSGAYAPCTSPKNYTVSRGSHTFGVRAKDGAGNVDPTPATRTWKVR
jgi:hypothetical protein